MLEELLSFYTTKIAIVGTILLFYFTLLALILTNHKVKFNKALMFVLIVATTIIPSLYFVVSTVYLNTVSVSGGPVHWHADVEIWACDEELQLKDPTGFLSNKIGTATLHEHNDKRIHLEGVVVTDHDATLDRFFHVIGGEISADVVSVPTNDGVKTLTSGGTCTDGTPAEMQVFVYSTKDEVYTQQKLNDPAAYKISPYSQVPAGDCIIVEYGPEKERTDKLCRSYKVAEELDKVRNGDISP